MSKEILVAEITEGHYSSLAKTEDLNQSSRYSKRTETKG